MNPFRLFFFKKKKQLPYDVGLGEAAAPLSELSAAAKAAAPLCFGFDTIERG